MQIRIAVSLVVAVIVLAPCSRAQPPFTNVNWVGLGPTNAALNGTAYALTIDSSGNIFAGGLFSSAGGVQLPSTGIWDGSKWSAAGSGLPLFNASWTYTYPQLASGGGFVYGLGSMITNGGGASVPGVARWDGSSWSNVTTNPSGNGPVLGTNPYTYAPLGPNVGPMPLAVAADGGGALYMGGYFASVDGVAAQNIAKWNGTNWTALGSGCEGPVTILATDRAGNVYAGGYFMYAGNVLANNIARWDGTN